MSPPHGPPTFSLVMQWLTWWLGRMPMMGAGGFVEWVMLQVRAFVRQLGCPPSRVRRIEEVIFTLQIELMAPRIESVAVGEEQTSVQFQ